MAGKGAVFIHIIYMYIKKNAASSQHLWGYPGICLSFLDSRRKF